MNNDPHCVEALTRRFTLNPRTTGVVSIGLQHGSGSRDPIARLVLPNVSRLLEMFRSLGAPVIHVTVGSARPDYSDCPRHVREFLDVCRNATDQREHVMLDALKPLAGEPVLNKTTTGAFASSNLEAELRSRNIREIVFTGISAEVNVDITAREAAERDFWPVLVSDATGTCGGETQDANLLCFGRLRGRVMSTDEVITEIRETAASDVLFNLDRSRQRLLSLDERILPYQAALAALAQYGE